MGGCKYIFKKGINKGNYCENNIYKYNLCKKHMINSVVKKSPVKKSPVTKTDCDNFIKNSNINPVTNRKIKKNGPVYNELIRFCENKNKTKNSVSTSLEKLKKICEEWFNNKNIDPISKKKIGPGGIIYNNLMRKCSDVQKTNDTNTFVEYKDKKHHDFNLFNICNKKSDKINRNNAIDKIEFGDDVILVPKIIGMWVLTTKLGKGGFGLVYECYHKVRGPNIKYAMKIEHELSFGLLNEFNLYSTFEKYKSKYVPEIYDYGIFNNLQYVVMETLYPFKFNFNRIVEVIDAIKSFAHMKLSHGDIKWDNMMQKKNGDLVFIDFGLTYPINERSKLEDETKVGGTLIYMSINSHRGIITYSNDLESLLYCILDMITKLPWDKNYDINDYKTIITKIGTLKIDTAFKIINRNPTIMKKFKFNEFPRLEIFADIVMRLKINDIPDYELLKKVFI